jgi:hypothetical protein
MHAARNSVWYSNSMLPFLSCGLILKKFGDLQVNARCKRSLCLYGRVVFMEQEWSVQGEVQRHYSTRFSLSAARE